MAQYTGTDGLTYTALETAAGVNLTINGNGPSYSMINGILSISGGSVDFKTTLYSVSVGAGVTSLGPNMFTGCTNLYSADISASTLTTIGYMAFDGCTALVSIGSTLPASLTTISDYAFSDCSSLRNIKFTSSVTSIGQSAFYGCSSLTITDFDKTNIPEIKGYTFFNCTAIEDVNIPEGVVSIGASAFATCYGLTTIRIPSTVTSIDSGAFQNCRGTGKTIYFMGPQPTTLGNGCFSMGNTSQYPATAAMLSPGNWAQSVFQGNTTLIGQYTTLSFSDLSFTGSDGLTYSISGTTLTVSGSGASTSVSAGRITTNNSSTFDFHDLTALVIQSGVTSLGTGSFSTTCRKLATVTLADSVTYIGESCFSGCSALTTFTPGTGLTSVLASAFRYCTALTTLSLNITTAGQYAFADCTGLTTLSLPNLTAVPDYLCLNDNALSNLTITSATSIGNSAFRECRSLTSVTANSVSTIGNSAFSNCTGITTVSFSSMTSIGTYAFGACTSLGSVTLPATLTTIGSYAFERCSSLTTSIPSGVTDIQDGAFKECTSLGNISIPAGTSTIGAAAFAGCTSMTAITVDPNNQTYSSEDGVLYYGHTLLIYPAGKADSEFTIDETITNIALMSFEGNANLHDLTVGSGVTTVEEGAFSGCYNISTITFLGSIDGSYIQFDSFSLGTDSNHQAYTTVLSINNWADGVVDGTGKSNEFTHFTFAPIYMGSDGLIYGFSDNVLTISGSGAISSLSAGILTLDNNTTVSLRTMTAVRIGSGITAVPVGTFQGCAQLSSLTVSADNSSLSSLNNVLFNANRTTLLIYPEGLASTSYAMPNTVTEIRQSAFSGNTHIESAPIPASVTTIGSYAFGGCTALTDISISYGITSIGSYAFSSCYSVTTITLSKSSAPTLGSACFALGNSEHAVEATVYSMGNWAANTLDSYKNQYTTFVYETIPMGGSDGLNYLLNNNVLTVVGNGPMTALTNGQLTTSIGAVVDITSMTSARIMPGVTSISSNAFTGCSSLYDLYIPETVTSLGSYIWGADATSTANVLSLNSSSIQSGDGVFPGDETALISNGMFMRGVYVFDQTTRVWHTINEMPFIITLSPNGGTFDLSVAAPTAAITAGYDSDGNAVTVNTQTKVFVPFLDAASGDTLYIWSTQTDAVKITMILQYLPYVRTSPGIDEDVTVSRGIVPPAAFNKLLKWETLVPYQAVDDGFYDDNGNEDPEYTPQTTDISTTTYEMKRASTEHVCQVVMAPFWAPARDGNLRCLTVTPGFGSLDFGAIQSIDRTYNAVLTTIPIVCYGYTGSFCMDLGVKGIVTINYIRTSPNNPDNTSYDSRKWSNAYWVKKFKELTNRWQMRTNGSTLYLKRPDLDRLTDGIYDNGMRHDPMKEYLSEINGDNCYITSAPVKYDTGNPYMIKNSVTFSIGTLYPKQAPYNMSKVVFEWPGRNDRIREIWYPSSTTAVLPSLPLEWDAYLEGDSYFFAKGWKIGNTEYQPGDYFIVPEYNTSVLHVQVDVGTSTQLTTRLIETDTSVTISGGSFFIVYVIGGGGGGGAAYRTYDTVNLDTIYGCAGGGGGASGRTSSGQIKYTDSCVVSISIGTGGAAGVNSDYNEREGTDGTAGNTTYVRVNNIQRVAAAGGEGGPRATGRTNPGTWGISTDRDLNNYVTSHSGSYPGGDGGTGSASVVYISSPDNASSGTAGHSSSGTHGLAGSAHNSGSGTYYRRGGGGGGGGATIPLNAYAASSAYAGSGTIPPSGRGIDGVRGGGGGGGGAGSNSTGSPSNIYFNNAGAGGDGLVYIVVPDGTIT